MAFSYAIVEFVEDDPPSVGISPQSWLDSKKDGMYCYWPKNNISMKAKKAEMPDKEKWTKYPVRILRHTDSYESAVLISKDAQFTSNLSSDDHEEQSKHQRKKPRSRPDSDADDEDDVEQRKRSKKSKNHNERTMSLPKAPELGICNTQNQRDIRDSEEIEISSQIAIIHRETVPSEEIEGSASTSTRKQTGSNKSFEERILDMFQELKDGQKELEAKIEQIIGAREEVGILEDVIPNPIDKIDEFDKLAEDLVDRIHRKKMVAFLMAFNGTTCLETVRMLLKKTVANNILAQYSLRGKKGKKPFQSHPLYKVILKAVMKLHKSGRQEIEDSLIEVLKHAPHMPGGPKHKKKTTRHLDISDLLETDSD